MGAQCSLQNERMSEGGQDSCSRSQSVVPPGRPEGSFKVLVPWPLPGLCRIRPGTLHFLTNPWPRANQPHAALLWCRGEGQGDLSSGDICLRAPRAFPALLLAHPVHIGHSGSPRWLYKQPLVFDLKEKNLETSLFSPGVKSKLNQRQWAVCTQRGVWEGVLPCLPPP